MSRRLLIAQMIVVFIIAVMDIHYGLNERYFWTVSWWDIPLHILGGLWAGLFAAWASLLLNIRISIVRCVLFAFIVGAGWELFEYAAHIGGSSFMSYPVDTIKDLFDDVIGGLIAGYTAKKLL